MDRGMSQFEFTAPGMVSGWMGAILLCMALIVVAASMKRDGGWLFGVSFCVVVGACLLMPDLMTWLKESGFGVWSAVLTIVTAGVFVGWLRQCYVRDDVAAEASMGVVQQLPDATPLSKRRFGHVVVRADSVQVVNLQSGKRVDVKPIAPYSTNRSPIAEFEPLENCLKLGFRRVGLHVWWMPSPRVLAEFKLAEHLGGSPTSIELRALQEACLGAGAREVRVDAGDGTGAGDVESRYEHLVANQP